MLEYELIKFVRQLTVCFAFSSSLLEVPRKFETSFVLLVREHAIGIMRARARGSSPRSKPAAAVDPRGSTWAPIGRPRGRPGDDDRDHAN